MVIRLERVSKRYHPMAGQGSVRDVVGSLAARLLHRNGTADRRDVLWALRDVSVEVKRGQSLGIVGRNGAGKTTILKLLARITQPTSGSVRTDGRLSSLIELGAGFHPDLTGRENTLLNGVMLGLTRRQVQQRFDDIVAFAELERFIDMPVKRYSSGMQARLGFAIAAHVDPDILIVDEVLAVGDASFQRKCFDHIHKFVNGQRTVVFVSHNLYVIEQLCDRAIWLENGRIAAVGTPAEVLGTYLDHVDQHALTSNAPVDSFAGQLRVTQVDFSDANGRVKDTFTSGEEIVARIKYDAPSSFERPHFVLAVTDAQGGAPLFLASMLVDGNTPARIEGEGVLRCRFKSVPLMPRVYAVWGEVWGADRARILLKWQRLGAFRIAGESDEHTQKIDRGSVRHVRVDGPVRVPYEWEHSS